jgi:hypothetical protein
MSSLYSIGSMNQLGDALEKNDFTADDLTKLKQFSNLKGIKDIIYGRAEIKYPEHLIDCDAAPFIPDGWSVEEHRKGGLYKFNGSKIPLYLSMKQKKGTISGHKLRKELVSQYTLNANILDYLLAHLDLIPEDWKDKYIFFWGTIYRNFDGYLFVRCLRWYGSKWDWHCDWLDSGFGSDSPAALAS